MPERNQPFVFSWPLAMLPFIPQKCVFKHLFTFFNSELSPLVQTRFPCGLCGLQTYTSLRTALTVKLFTAHVQVHNSSTIRVQVFFACLYLRVFPALTSLSCAFPKPNHMMWIVKLKSLYLLKTDRLNPFIPALPADNIFIFPHIPKL